MNEIYRSQFRMPYSVYESLKEAADQNHRSVNAELVARLEESFAAEQIASGSEVEKRLSAQFSSLMSEFQELKERIDKQR